jgi:hypothetical protein
MVMFLPKSKEKLSTSTDFTSKWPAHARMPSLREYIGSWIKILKNDERARRTFARITRGITPPRAQPRLEDFAIAIRRAKKRQNERLRRPETKTLTTLAISFG